MRQITLILAIVFVISCVSCEMNTQYKVNHTEFEVVDSTWIGEKSTLEPNYHFYRTNSGRTGCCSVEKYHIGDTIKYIYVDIK
jgi:hypothetical protein